jgi:hypothetical protein
MVDNWNYLFIFSECLPYEILRKSVKWFRHSYWQTWFPYNTFILLSPMCSIHEIFIDLRIFSISEYENDVHIRKYCDSEKYISRLWQIYTKVCFWNAASLSLTHTHTHTRPLLVPRWLDEFYPYSVFELFFFFFVNVNILTSKTIFFFRTGLMIVIKFQ